jgi:hypothetical protein
MTESSDEMVLISKADYDTMIANNLFAEMAGDFIESLPIDMADVFEDDPRFKDWVRMVNHEWYEEMYGVDK